MGHGRQRRFRFGLAGMGCLPEQLLVEEGTIQAVPAMAGTLQSGRGELDPAEMAYLPALVVAAMARNTGGIEVSDPTSIPVEGDPLALGTAQGVMHMSEDHQRQRSLPLDSPHRQGQILVAPVAGGSLPVATAEITGIIAEPGRSAMGQQHQRQGGIRGKRGMADAIGRFLHPHRAEHRLGGPGQVMPAAGGGRAPPHHCQARGIKGAESPAAVKRSKPLDLTLQLRSGGILAGVVVAEHAGHRQGELLEQKRDPSAPLAQITHQQQGIRPEAIQKLVVRFVPEVVEVSGDGDLQLGQRRRLPRLLPS